MVKNVVIGGKDVKMEATAFSPVYYKKFTGRDLFVDCDTIIASGFAMDMNNFEIISNMAFVFAKQANPDMPDNVEEWLRQYDDILSIYKIFSEVLDLWNGNTATTSKAKKKAE